LQEQGNVESMFESEVFLYQSARRNIAEYLNIQLESMRRRNINVHVVYTAGFTLVINKKNKYLPTLHGLKYLPILNKAV